MMKLPKGLYLPNQIKPNTIWKKPAKKPAEKPAKVAEKKPAEKLP